MAKIMSDIPRKRLAYYGLFLIFGTLVIWFINHLYMSAIPSSFPQRTINPLEELSALVGMQINIFWTPNQKALMDSQTVVREYLKKANPVIFKKFEYYAADYCGYIAGGRRYMYFSYYFHNPQGGSNYLKYTTFPLFALDGGDSFFQVIYDAVQNKVLRLTVNGVA